MDAYVMVYLLSNALVTFAIERFMRVFFEKRRCSFWVGIIPYTLYFALTSTTFLLIRIPAISMVISIAMFYVITLVYRATILRRLIAAVGVLVFMLIIDALTFVVTNSEQASFFYEVESQGITGFIIWGLASYSTAVAFQKFKNIKHDFSMHPFHILAAISIPGASVFLIQTIVATANIPQLMIIVSIAIVFSINVITFSLQDALVVAYREQLLSKIHAQEKEHYLTQCHMMKESVESMKAFRHDVKLHFGTLESMALRKDITAVSSYLKNLSEYVNSDEIYCDTGNIAFDSIINYKFRSISEKNIKINLELSYIPDNCMEVIDITAILGNLIDNALDAIAQVEDKWINLSIMYLKGTLHIEMSNPFNGVIATEKRNDISLKEIKSSKKAPDHGYGLKNIKKSVLNYNGEIEISFDNNIFTVSIFLFTK